MLWVFVWYLSFDVWVFAFLVLLTVLMLLVSHLIQELGSLNTSHSKECTIYKYLLIIIHLNRLEYTAQMRLLSDWRGGGQRCWAVLNYTQMMYRRGKTAIEGRERNRRRCLSVEMNLLDEQRPALVAIELVERRARRGRFRRGRVPVADLERRRTASVFGGLRLPAWWSWTEGIWATRKCWRFKGSGRSNFLRTASIGMWNPCRLKLFRIAIAELRAPSYPFPMKMEGRSDVSSEKTHIHSNFEVFLHLWDVGP